mmetsp:Transcript_79543/g.116604  ORF Transcript_79543/g.116604 Transcript_79543/m.116604 type:complete len:345 (-) Transcript_79543:132-1166(-)
MATTHEVARQDKKLESSGLLVNDSVAQAASNGAPATHLELSGAIDILWQLKDPRNTDEHIVEIQEESRQFMAEFFERVRQCKDTMVPIRKNINLIKELHTKIITEVSQTKSKEYSNKLDELLTQTSRQARGIKDELKALEDENSVYEERFGRQSAEFKIHLNMHGSVTKKFIELMREYEATQGKYKALLKQRVARQVKVANPNATDAEVAEAVEAGGSNIFVDKVLSNADQVAMNAYADVQSKHQDLMRLEASIKEVHQLFMDMALMVEAQGELLDNIEEMVSSSAEYTGSGVKELVKAKEIQKSARKKMCCIVVCCAILMMILMSYVSIMIPGLRRRMYGTDY